MQPLMPIPSVRENVRLRNQILRGVRIAAILITLGLIALVVYQFVPFGQVRAEAPKPSTKPAVIGGSTPGGLPPPPPARGSAISN